MSESTPSTLTCPTGHTFPSEQLTTRDGQLVCPVCDQQPWATPRVPRPWSRAVLTNPLLLLGAAIVMFVVEAISGIGIGTTYGDQHLVGAGWLIAGSAVGLVGIGILGVGVARIIISLRSQSWSRTMLSVPLLIVGGGLALLAVGDLFELGLNIAFVNASDPGATWQLIGQIFDSLFFGGIAGALVWVSLLARRPDDVASQAPDNAGGSLDSPSPALSHP